MFDIGVPVLPPPVYALKLLKYLADYVEYVERERTFELATPEKSPENPIALSEFESKQLLAKYNVPIQAEIIAKTVEEAVAFARK